MHTAGAGGDSNHCIRGSEKTKDSVSINKEHQKWEEKLTEMYFLKGNKRKLRQLILKVYTLPENTYLCLKSIMLIVMKLKN